MRSVFFRQYASNVGADESALYIGWDRKASRLVLVFKVRLA